MSKSEQIICDCHCHSEWSFDGSESTDDICRKAVEKGIDVIAITDHCEANGWNNPDESEFGNFAELIPQSAAHMKESQKKYAGKVKLLRGIELGQAMQDLEAAEKSLALDDFDFVLASVHNVRNMRDFYWLDYEKLSVDELLKTYFKEILEVVRWNRFDSLAHLTYPLRYISGKSGIKVDMSRYFYITDEIFKTLTENGKALEVNTSGLRQELGKTMPDAELLKRYRELGGEYITIGSDAHCSEDIGSGINEAIKLLHDTGFTKYHYFEQHKPVEILIK